MNPPAQAAPPPLEGKEQGQEQEQAGAGGAPEEGEEWDAELAAEIMARSLHQLEAFGRGGTPHRDATLHPARTPTRGPSLAELAAAQHAQQQQRCTVPSGQPPGWVTFE